MGAPVHDNGIADSILVTDSFELFEAASNDDAYAKCSSLVVKVAELKHEPGGYTKSRKATDASTDSKIQFRYLCERLRDIVSCGAFGRHLKIAIRRFRNDGFSPDNRTRRYTPECPSCLQLDGLTKRSLIRTEKSNYQLKVCELILLLDHF
jgi:hypothetical protein